MKIIDRLKSTKAFNPLLMLFYGLIVGAVGYIIIVSRAAPAPPNVYLTPATKVVPVNTSFTVDIRETSGTTAVNAVQANLSYNATLFDFVSIDTTNTAFSTVAQATGGSGQVTFAGGTAAGGATVTGDQYIARVTFKSKAASGNAAFTFTSGTALVNASTNNDILGSLSNTTGGTFTVDATAPTVSVTAPANSTVLAGGSTNTISVAATDNTGVSKVEIYIDGSLKTTLTSSPYNYSWNTTGLSLGGFGHSIYAKAYDAYGNSATSATNSVFLTDQTAPTVSISSPGTTPPLSGTVTITAAASDNSGGSGVNRVEFLIDGKLKGSDTTSPYTYSWNTKTDADGADGPHSLTAKAYDNASPANTKTSAAVAVTVDNADHTAPTTPGSFRSTSQTLTSIDLAWTASTDNVAVTGYRLQRNGNTIATLAANATSYSNTGLTAGTGYSYSLVALDAAGNASSAATVTVSTKSLKQGDVNNDNKVDIFDLSLLLSKWNTSDNNCDINDNGVVDIFDLSALLSKYGT